MVLREVPALPRAADAPRSNASVCRVLEARVAATPDKLLFAFLGGDGELLSRYTYSSFAARVDLIASHLAARPNLKPGDRLLLVYAPGLEIICALFACAKAGLIAVPCPPVSVHGARSTLHQLSHVLEDCAASAILLDSETESGLAAALDGLLADGAGSMASSVERIVTDRLLGPAPVSPAREPNEILFLQYTSGSTNQPKGVLVTHENILHNCTLVVDHDNIVGVTWLPQHHDMGLIGYYLYVALSGGTTYGLSPASFIERPALWLETISKYRATATSAPNFAFELCLQPHHVPDEMLQGLDLGSLVFLMAAAEPIRVDTYRRFLQRFRPAGLDPSAFFVAYGLAECTLAVTNHGRTFAALDQRLLSQGIARDIDTASGVLNVRHLMSCGRPLGDTQIEIVDPVTRVPVPDGAVGEIWIAGKSVCRGYWGKPEKTAADFRARLAGTETDRPFLRTGDMGFMRQGELYVCGRRKDMIIIRGENHYPQDIERMVEDRSPLVHKGGVAAFEIAGGDDEPIVVVVAEVLDAGRLPEPRDLVRHVLESLGVRISRLLFVPRRAVDKTSSGKLRRFATRDRYIAGELPILSAHDFAEAAGDAREEEIYELAQLRERYGLTGEEDFTLFDAGIDSLDLVTILHWLKDALAFHGAESVSEMVDSSVLGIVTVRQIFEIGPLFATEPGTAIAAIRHFLETSYRGRREEQQRMMRADRFLGFDPPRPAALPWAASEMVLLTGATGFLGPYLLRSLLTQTEAKIVVLLRGASDEQVMSRLRRHVGALGDDDIAWLEQGASRIVPVCGDIEQQNLGMPLDRWTRLSREVDTIYHGAALVNYLYDYRRMRSANVVGTEQMLRFAFAGRPKQFNHVSTTFIFGWTVKERVGEADSNEGMEKLNFGYSQSKWVSEQLVFDAQRKGLAIRVFRPSLISPSLAGGGSNLDITIRLLAFMIKHGIGVSSRNQVSLTPVDAVAHNLVALANMPETLNRTFHLTRDTYERMSDVTDILAQRLGRPFELFDIHVFVSEVIRRCTREDPLFPLLDFLIGSVDDLAAMEVKLYDNAGYRSARARSEIGRTDPSLGDVVDGILAFLRRHGLA
ncbi:MAG: fatty acyl-AMP ligase [Pseudomonadota bacterium]